MFTSHPSEQASYRRTRTVSKKVYGKRKTDAPRAILEREDTTSKDRRDKKPLSHDDVDSLLSTVQKNVASLNLEDKGRSPDVISNDATNIERKTQDSVQFQEQSLSDYHVPSKERRSVEVRIVNQKPRGKSTAKAHGNDGTPTTASRPKRTSQKHGPRRSSGCIQDIKTNSYVQPILSEATSTVASSGVRKFDSWAQRAGNLFSVEKIAEGSYGEVYRMRFKEDSEISHLSKSRLARLKAYNNGVFKIVPLRAQRGPGSKRFTTVQEIVSEVQMLKLLDAIPGFARFREVHVVQGRFPKMYQEAWTKYATSNDDSMNPDPSKKTSYSDTQLWVILEMDHAGHELEKFSWSSVFQVYDIFWGVAMALARAEQFAAFEHRDLHLGNICIKSTRKGGNIVSPFEVQLDEIGQQPTGFGLSGLETTVIDYSLSRAELVQAGSDSASAKPVIAWSDLDKKGIFDAIGRDEDEKLLRNTYRDMRSQIYFEDPLFADRGTKISPKWAEYHPKTNLIWLLFLLKMLLKKCKPNSPVPPTRQPLGARSTNGKLATHNSTTGSQFKYAKPGSTPLKSDPDVETKRLISEMEDDLRSRLDIVLDMLSLEDGDENLYCAGDLVAFAIGSEWLAVENFLC